MKTWGRLSIGAVMLAVGAWTSAQDVPRAKATQIFAEMMSEYPGKQVRSFIVEFPPGAESVPHSHPGPILAYVLSGTWIMRMDGMPEMTLQPGQVAYEHANHRHLVSRNQSKTEPLKLLVFFISEPDAAVSIPLAK